MAKALYLLYHVMRNTLSIRVRLRVTRFVMLGIPEGSRTHKPSLSLYLGYLLLSLVMHHFIPPYFFPAYSDGSVGGPLGLYRHIALPIFGQSFSAPVL